MVTLLLERASPSVSLANSYGVAYGVAYGPGPSIVSSTP
jgi:hypothetical protein